MCSGFQFGRSALLRFSLLFVLLQGLLATAAVNPLPFRPIDPGYSRSLDRLIFISASPDQLHIYNVADRSDQVVALPATPLNVSVGPDGTHAAVASSASVSYVNLQNAAVERTVNMTLEGAKVILGVGYAYTFPRYQGYAQSINLSTGEVTNNGFANADRPVFDPALNAIYTTDYLLNHYNATGVLTWNSSQTVEYYSVLSVCGPLSLSESGDTIYTGCGTIFRASNDATKDMRYLGILPGVQRVGSLAQSGTLSQIAMIPLVQSYVPGTVLNDDTVVSLFDSAFFNPVGQLATTPFTVNSVNYAAHGRWVFYNSASSSLILITQADPTAALTQDFAVEDVDLRNPNSCNAVFGATAAPIAAAGAYAATPILSPQNCLFSAASNAPWITLASGFFGSGNTSLRYVVRPNLGSSPRSGTISIGSEVFTINQEGQTGASDTTPLSFKAIAAEYDKALDKIVMVSAPPNELHLYDPVTHDDDIVPLNSIPLSVSVRPDGLVAAVGHSGSISIVDLQARAITQTLGVDMNNASLILASNGYVYSFPVQPAGGNNVRSIQLSNGTAASLTCPNCSFARLVPSGDAVYAGGSRLDISNGPAAIVSSNYSYSLGNFWLSESGDRLLSANGNAFLTSTSPALDLNPNGRLSGSDSVAWASNSQRLQQTAVLTDIASGTNTQLQLYADQGLSLQSQITLPGFTNAGRNYFSHGRYLFWNAAASKLFAIIQADSTSGLLSDYAVYTVNNPGSVPACSYAVSPSGLTVPNPSYSVWFFDVTSNCTWSAVLTSGSSSWLYGLNNGFTTGDGRASFTVSTTSGAIGSASIKIGDKTATVTLAPASCTYSISATSRSFSQAGGTGEVNLATDPSCPWSIQSSVPWLSVTGSQMGTGSATIRYSVASNTTSSSSRSGALNLAG